MRKRNLECGSGPFPAEAEAERENSTTSASKWEGRMKGEKKLVLLSFGEERIEGA